MLRLLVGATLLLFGGTVNAACDTLPSWTIRNFETKARDAVGPGGTASFEFTDVLTNKTDTLTCPLVANYRCQIDGTPSDTGTTINIQLMIDVAFTTVNQKWSCEGNTTAVIGSGDVYLLCETVPWGESNCKIDGEAATIKGFVE